MNDAPMKKGKARITIRLDRDILDWFKGEVGSVGGGSYQTLINRALREHINGREQLNEDILRKIIREELAVSRNSVKPYKSNTLVPR